MAEVLVWKDEWDSSDALLWLDVLELKVDSQTYVALYNSYTKLDTMLHETNEGKVFHNDAGDEISTDELVDELHDVVGRIFELASR